MLGTTNTGTGGRVQRRRSTTALLIIGLTAILSAACGPPPVPGPPVDITTERTPPVAYGGGDPLPYSLQLEATGAEPMAISWSVARGQLPPGMSLSSSGLLTGGGGPSPRIVQVRATAGGPADTQLLAFLPPSYLRLTSSGSPLPEGTELVIRHTEEYGQFIGLVNYSAAGTTSVPTEYSLQDASHLDQYPQLWAALSPDGSRAAVALGSAVWNQPPPPIGIVDTDSGAVLTELAEEVLLGAYRVQFSPDGRYLLVGVPGESTKVFDASTGALLRTVANGPGDYMRIATWVSLDEFARTSTGKIDVFSVTDETLDRELPLADGCHGPYFASVPTQRMALECGDELVTVSTVDGADERTINAGCAASTCGLDSSAVQFSPSGSHVAFTGSDSSGFDTVFVVADQHGATPTAMATVTSNRWHRAIAAAWH